MTRRDWFLTLIDRAIAALVAATVVGTTLAFGGAVWWARPGLAVLTLLTVLITLGRMLVAGSWCFIKSPLPLLGMLALLLGVLQLAPLPDAVASRLSPRSAQLHALGYWPDRVEDPSFDAPEAESGRWAATLDRSATLRWLVSGLIGLGLFWAVGQFTDRYTRLVVVWGSVVAAFALNTALGLVQGLGHVPGLYSAIEPGKMGVLGPTLDDLWQAPGESLLRPVEHAPEATAETAWAIPRPKAPYLFGTMMGGPGAYLALGALALPLGMGLLMQLLAPRGSREPLLTRLRLSGHWGLVLLLLTIELAGAGLVGLWAGPFLSVPFALGLMLVGTAGSWRSGLRWSAAYLTLGMLAALAAGILIGDPRSRTEQFGTRDLRSARLALGASKQVWLDARQIVSDFPAFGTGLGSFDAVFPLYKSLDRTPSTAESTLVQWTVESGGAGLVLLALASLWCLVKLPRALRRVGTADRPLAFGLVGALVCFSMFAAVHWTVELPAVAVAFAAVGASANRWLAGGTDLFV